MHQFYTHSPCSRWDRISFLPSSYGAVLQVQILMFQLLCSSAYTKDLSASHTVLTAKRLGAGQKQESRPRPKWPKGHSSPYDSMLSNKTGELARRATAAQGLAGHWLVRGKQLFCASLAVYSFAVVFLSLFNFLLNCFCVNTWILALHNFLPHLPEQASAWCLALHHIKTTHFFILSPMSSYKLTLWPSVKPVIKQFSSGTSFLHYVLKRNLLQKGLIFYL